MSTQYYAVGLEEFESFLNSFAKYERKESNARDEKEYVFDIPLPSDEVVIRIFSGIDIRTDVSRECGADAIRTVLWHKEHNCPVGGRSRTHRINTWQSNLKPKILELALTWKDAYRGECECGHGVYQVREGKYGKFLGCSDYPRCKNTKQVE